MCGSSATHCGVFVALNAIDVPAGHRAERGRLVIFAVLLTMTLLADSFALIIGVLPVLLIGVLGSRRDRPYGEFRLGAVSLAALASVAAARGL